MKIVKNTKGLCVTMTCDWSGLFIVTQSTGRGAGNQIHQMKMENADAVAIALGILESTGETGQIPLPTRKQCPRCAGVGEVIAPWGRQPCPDCGLTGVVDAE